MWYLLLILLGLWVFYFSVFLFRPYFWPNSDSKIGASSYGAILLVAFSSLFVYILTLNMENEVLGNRILHGVGGGFIGFMTWFLAVTNFEIPLNRLAVFILGFLLVSTLGVVNEIAEFFLQNYFDVLAAESINDTWLDLISNTIGILVAAVILLPFLKINKK